MRTIGLFFLILLTIQLNGQTCVQKEIQLEYSNGYEVFNICKTNPNLTFDEKLEYFWYTEFSQIKSTKGGCGGNLLDGNYKFYDEYGNLRVDKNYSLGIENGNEMTWDSIGNITSKAKYKAGEKIYWKFRNEENLWVEYDGPFYSNGTIWRFYTSYGKVIKEEKILPELKRHVKIFYENQSNQLQEEYTTGFHDRKYMYGKYQTWYDNGKIETDGQYFEGRNTNIQEGIWKWYNRDGTIHVEEIYKAEIEYWPNGKLKMSGANVFNENKNEWVKAGEWIWYDEEGSQIKKKEFFWGEEVNRGDVTY